MTAAPTAALATGGSAPRPVAHATPGTELAAGVVRAGVVVRLACLLVALVGYVGDELTPGAAAALLVLATSGGVVLLLPRVLEVVVRHPLLSLADLGAVVVVLVGLGPESPLVLATYATALVVGVLLPLRSSAPLLGVLLTGYWASLARTPEPDAVAVVVGTPAVYVLLGVLGAAVRRSASEHARAQEELSAALAAAAASAERTRVAREVHDSVAASLQGIALELAALPTWLERDPDLARRRARRLAASAADAVEQARDLLVRLRLDPGARDASAAVLEAVRGWQQRHDRPVDVEVADVGPLDPQQRHEVVAALDEALENVARHAGPCSVRVSLQRCGADLLLLVQDEGVGVDLAELPRREAEGHFGLRGLRERMAALGGRADVSGRPGLGTRVALRWPAARSSGRAREEGVVA